jgi:hypothetical protein
VVFVKIVALGGFMASPQPDPALLDRLEQETQLHGFDVTTQ